MLATKIPTEKDIVSAIQSDQLQLPPLEFRVLEVEPSRPRGDRHVRPDLALEVAWGGARYVFDVEVKAKSTPKMVREALAVLQTYRTSNRMPMLIVPYLSSKQIAELEQEKISGIDLCGNGIVIVPGEMLVCRTGQRNEFRSSDPIKNVFRGSSSIVARAFLVRPWYSSVNAIKDEIDQRGGGASLATVSKALKAMGDRLMVSRNEESIRLLQPDKLLDALVENYEPPTVRDRFKVRASVPFDMILSAFARTAEEERVRWVLTGACSVSKYAVMAREEKLSLYVDGFTDEPLKEIRRRSRDESSRFANVEVLDVRNRSVYFDCRPDGDWRWSSPVQTYLELMKGDKRDKETAESIRDLILRDVGR